MKTLVFFLFSINLWASDKNTCHENAANDYDLRDKFESIRNQDSIGWCYAHAAADLLTYHLRENGSIGKKESVSATGISLMTNSERRAERQAKLSFFSKPSLMMGLSTMNSFTRNTDKRKQELEDQIEVLDLQYSKRKTELLNKRPDLIKKKQQAEKKSKEEKEKINNDIMGYLMNDPEFRNILFETDLKGTELDLIEKSPKGNSGFTIPKAEEPEGGFSQRAASRALRDGFCLESQMPSDDSIIPEKYSALIASKENMPEASMADLFKYFTSEQDKTEGRVFEEPCCDEYENVFRSTFNISKPIFDAIHKSLDPLGELSHELCVGKSKTPLSIDSEKLEDSPNKMKEFYDKNEPFTVSMDANFFDFGEEALDEKKADPDYERSGHAVLVIGKKTDCKTGKSKLIIRNSWGSNSCKKDRDNFRSLSSKNIRSINAEKKIDKIYADCEAGSFSDYSASKEAAICIDKAISQTKMIRKSIHPNNSFECDDKGNYIVDEDRFFKMSSRVSGLKSE